MRSGAVVLRKLRLTAVPRDKQQGTAILQVYWPRVVGSDRVQSKRLNGGIAILVYGC